LGRNVDFIEPDVGRATTAASNLPTVYFEDESGRRSAAKLLSKDEGAKDCSEHRQAAGAQAA